MILYPDYKLESLGGALNYADVLAALLDSVSVGLAWDLSYACTTSPGGSDTQTRFKL